MRTSLLQACGLAAALTTTPLFGAHYTSTWIGGASGNWSSGANWDNGVPDDGGGDTYDAVVSGAAVDVNGTFTIQALSTDASASVSIGTTRELTLNADSTNNGVIRLNDTTVGIATLTVDGSVTLNGSGEVLFDGTQTQNLIDDTGSSPQLTIGADQTVRTNGAGTGGSIDAVTINYGTIDADGGTISLTAALTNNGLLSATNGGTVSYSEPSPLVNTGGTISIDATSTFNLHNEIEGGVIEGGGTLVSADSANSLDGTPAGGLTLDNVTVVIDTGRNLSLAGTITNNGVIRLNDTTVGIATLTVDGSVTLDGSGEVQFDGTQAQNLIDDTGSSPQLTIGADQSLVAASGKSGTVGVATTNEGTIEVAGSIGFSLVSANSFINEGMIVGTGTLSVSGSSAFRNDGAVSPGDGGPGVLTFDGVYNQSTLGMLVVEIGGIAAGVSYDQLAIIDSGDANLNGTLEVTFVGGFTPSPTDLFTVLMADGAVIGTFSNTPGNVLTLSQGTFQVAYNADSVVLYNFQSSATAVPEPSGLAVFLATFSVLCLATPTRRRIGRPCVAIRAAGGCPWSFARARL
jgi:hypothetical protein